MAKSPKLETFAFSSDDPFAAEHVDVSQWVEDAVASRGAQQYYEEVDLKSLPSGKKLLDADP